MNKRNLHEEARVLVVDDDPDALDEMADGLRDVNLTVLTATNSKDALELAGEHRPAFVLMDFSLPGMNGLDTVMAMQGFLPDTTFIMMSGNDDFCRIATTSNTKTFAILKKPLAMGGIARFIQNTSLYDPPDLTVVDLLTN